MLASDALNECLSCRLTSLVDEEHRKHANDNETSGADGTRLGSGVCGVRVRVWRVADRARETSERDEQWGRDERAAGPWAWLWSSGLVIRFRNVCACGYATVLTLYTSHYHRR